MTPEPWAAYFQAHYDALPAKVRAAVRDYPQKVNSAELRRLGRTEVGMLKMLADGVAPLSDSDYRAAEAAIRKAA